MPETVEKRVGGGRCTVFGGRKGRDADMTDRRERERGDQVLIATISGPAPRIVIIRFRL